MLANVFDGQCVDRGGQWCTAAAMWDDSLGKLPLLGILVCALLLIFMVVSRVLRGVHSFTESRKGDL
jgi:hypothetical protein